MQIIRNNYTTERKTIQISIDSSICSYYFRLYLLSYCVFWARSRSSTRHSIELSKTFWEMETAFITIQFGQHLQITWAGIEWAPHRRETHQWALLPTTTQNFPSFFHLYKLNTTRKGVPENYNETLFFPGVLVSSWPPHCSPLLTPPLLWSGYKSPSTLHPLPGSH